MKKTVTKRGHHDFDAGVGAGSILTISKSSHSPTVTSNGPINNYRYGPWPGIIAAPPSLVWIDAAGAFLAGLHLPSRA